MKRVFVLGHRGMLGQMVRNYLQGAGYEVVTSDHRYGGQPDEPLLHAVRASGCGWIINGLGAIPQKSPDEDALFRSNTLFPIHLLQAMEPGQRLIHASSDCVFSGTRGAYKTADFRDADSPYGLSKALGETVALDERVLCLRVSLVGPGGRGKGKGLLSWFLDQKGAVAGYSNHYWNGITTLEWAKTVEEVIHGAIPWRSGVVQVGSPERVSKFQLLEWFGEIWEKDISVVPTKTPATVDRSLVPDWIRLPLRQQLEELHAWDRAHLINNGNPNNP